MMEAEPSAMEAVSPPEAPADREDRVFTVPNLISLIRLLGSLTVFWLLFAADNLWGAALLWVALLFTDRLDGWCARRFNATSKLGKTLDACSDRGLNIVCIIAVGAYGAVPWWLVVMVLAREVLVALGGLLFIGMFGDLRCDATFEGKCSNVAIAATFVLFMLSEVSSAALAEALRVAGWVCAVPTLFLSYWSAAQYASLAVEAWRRSRSGE